MPAEARPRARRLPSGRWQLRYTVAGQVRSGGAFASKTEALNHFRDVVEPELRGVPAPRRDLTLSDLVDLYLERHGTIVHPTTIATLRARMKHPLDKFGEVGLDDIQRMTDEIAGFAASLPDRFRYSVMSAFRQTCAAGIRYGYMTQNPAKAAGRNPAPPPRSVRVFTPAELTALCAELDTRGAAAIRFAADTGLRPSEWAHVERRDINRQKRILTVRGTKTKRSFREVPLTTGALQALDSLVARLDSPYVFAGPKRGPFDVHNFRRRQWNPAVTSSGVAMPARLYDLRSTFASNALTRLTVYELARIMGTSVAMIESHYGALLDTAHESLLERLDAVSGMSQA
jgi:integrase